MELIKRKILLEDSIDRNYDSLTWGQVTATTFYINVMVTQNIDNMGMFKDITFIENITGQTITNLTETERLTLRLPSKTIDKYYTFGNSIITGATDSKIEDVRSYNAVTPFIPNFDINKSEYLNYNNILVNGVDRVKSLDEPKIYVFDTDDNLNLGTINQTSGLKFSDYSGITRNVTINDTNVNIPLTTVSYIGEGFNETNTSLSASIKEEYLFGIISPPEVENQVFIDRGVVSIMDMHLRLSEIKDLGQLSRYGNGFYKINKQ